MITQKNYYRIVRPYESKLVHSSSTLQGGAGKCFKELIKVQPSATDFSILDLYGNEVFDFNVNKPPISQELLLQGQIANLTLDDVKKMVDRINTLEQRIISLENKLNREFDIQEVDIREEDDNSDIIINRKKDDDPANMLSLLHRQQRTDLKGGNKNILNEVPQKALNNDLANKLKPDNISIAKKLL